MAGFWLAFIASLPVLRAGDTAGGGATLISSSVPLKTRVTTSVTTTTSDMFETTTTTTNIAGVSSSPSFSVEEECCAPPTSAGIGYNNTDSKGVWLFAYGAIMHPRYTPTFLPFIADRNQRLKLLPPLPFTSKLLALDAALVDPRRAVAVLPDHALKFNTCFSEPKATLENEKGFAYANIVASPGRCALLLMR